MTDGQADVSRRGFLRAASAGTATAAAVGTAAAAEDGGNETNGGGDGGAAPEPDYGGWLDDVSNFSSLQDFRGQDSVTVSVGAEGNTGFFAFGPPAIHVDPGTEIVWEWTGRGSSHNVIDEAGEFESELTAEEGFTYTRTFDSDGMYKYYCQPHRTLGMKGVVIVGTDYPTAGGDGGGGGGPQQLPEAAKTFGIATTFVMVLTLGLAYFFMKYGGDYGELGE